MSVSNTCLEFKPIYPVGKAYMLLLDDDASIVYLAEEIADHNEIWENSCANLQ